MQELCATHYKNSKLLTVKKTWAFITLEINSEKKYKIVKLLNTDKDKLSEN